MQILGSNPGPAASQLKALSPSYQLVCFY
uniref:Uncharacterized protein n=1 Tax=Arundo donax TaxID=35708 RepID=A0A0A9FKG2_ARUDO